MGFFDGIIGAIAPAVGTFFGGPVGGIIGSAVGGAISGHSAEQGQREQNQLNQMSAETQMAFQREMTGRQESFQSSQISGAQAYNSLEAGIGRDFNADQAVAARAFNRTEAERNRDFQMYMSDTANVRAMNDLTKAGLNPMLAMHAGGASSPAGSMASAGAAQSGFASSGFASGSTASGSAPRMESPKLAALNSAAVLSKVAAEIENIRADTDVRRSQALVNAVQVPKIEQDTKTSISSAAHLDAQTKDILERLRVLMPEQHAKLASEVFLNNARSNLTIEQWHHEFEKKGLTKAEAKLATLEIPRAQNYANTQDTWYMRNISPYLPDFLKGAVSGRALRGAVR